METTRFDRMTASVTIAPSRRAVLRLLGAAVASTGGLTFLGAAEGAAKRRRKKKKGKKPQQATCRDGRQNGAETDVDCGGTCPRCNVGKTCASRDDCTTALCVDNACTEPAGPADCGLDTDGSNCFTRTNAANQKICTRQNGRFFTEGTCAQRCLASEQCVLPVSGGVECVLPCGAPDA